jgi:transposase
MILAVVIDGEGRPICTEMLPGNSAEATVLLPVVDRLRERFHIGRVCVVADRGMISAATIAALEKRKLEYILGARERSSAVVRRLVFEDEQSLTPLLVERARGETQFFVTEFTVGAAHYILCRNEAEAERDRSERQRSSPGSASSWRAATRR